MNFLWERILAGAFSLIVMAAGWYYVFYSSAARNLTGIEDAALNARRIRLRRFGGVAMMLLAVAFYGGMRGLEDNAAAGVPPSFTPLTVACWVAVFVTLGVILVLGLIDVRLTRRLRRGRQRHSDS